MSAPKEAVPLQDKVLLTFAEAGALCGIGETIVSQLVASGDLACVQIGTLRRISRRALEQFADPVPPALLAGRRKRA